MSRELWRLGKTSALGFIDPEANLVYIRHDLHEHGVVLSIEDLAKIIVAHQARRRAARQENKQ